MHGPPRGDPAAVVNARPPIHKRLTCSDRRRRRLLRLWALIESCRRGAGRVERELEVGEPLRRGPRHCVRFALIQVGREIAPRDLGRGPPERSAAARPAPRPRASMNWWTSPVNSMPRRTGRNGDGATWAPMRAAICSATASACCAASPPCLIGKFVASPAQYTSSRPSTRPCSSTGIKPESGSAGTPSSRVRARAAAPRRARPVAAGPSDPGGFLARRPRRGLRRQNSTPATASRSATAALARPRRGRAGAAPA